MKIFVLTVLLAVMQASPPTPRKATNNPAQAGAQVKGGREANQAKPLPAPPSTKTDGDGPAKGNSAQESGEDTQNTVGISKLPPVTITPASNSLTKFYAIGWNWESAHR